MVKMTNKSLSDLAVYAVGLLFMFFSTSTLAQGAPSGGLFAGNIESVGDQVKTTIIWVTFTMALIYIVWQVVEVIFDRKTWSDIIAKCLVAVALGATPAAVLALWELGHNISLN